MVMTARIKIAKTMTNTAQKSHWNFSSSRLSVRIGVVVPSLSDSLGGATTAPQSAPESRSRRSALVTTSNVTPISAAMAAHREARPANVKTTKVAFTTNDILEDRDFLGAIHPTNTENTIHRC